MGSKHNAERGYLDGVVAEVWRTPNASDGAHGGPNARDSAGNPHLTAQAAAGETTGALNPDWVDALMMYPIGWSCVSHDDDGTIEQMFDEWRQHGPTGYPCTDEVLRVLRETASPQEVQREARGQRRVLAPSVLRSVLLRSWVEGRIGQGLSTPEAREEASRYVLRVLRHYEATRNPSSGRGSQERVSGESDDSLCGLSYEAALGYGQDHLATFPQVAGLGAPQHEWEPPRLTTEKQHRAARLKADGNSIVPQVARLWLSAIKDESERP